MPLVIKQLQHNDATFSLSCQVPTDSKVRVTEMSTYGLRRVCIRMVCGVEPSVCRQHCVEHAVVADHTMI